MRFHVAHFSSLWVAEAAPDVDRLQIEEFVQTRLRNLQTDCLLAVLDVVTRCGTEHDHLRSGSQSARSITNMRASDMALQSTIAPRRVRGGGVCEAQQMQQSSAFHSIADPKPDNDTLAALVNFYISTNGQKWANSSQWLSRSTV